MNIVLGVTGGIAAYKSVELVRLLRQQQHHVRVVMTDSAKEFVTPLTFQAISGNPVADELFDREAEAAMGHIELAKWADRIIVAPATSNFIAKLAHGFADDLLTTLCSATQAAVFIAPGMNQAMWHSQANQDNISICEQRGITILGPDEGEQACGDVGLGRMMQPDEIIRAMLPQPLKGVKIMLTAGPTLEPLDPVRYLSNHSSGKMGYALASQAQQLGAEVTLISGPVSLGAPNNIRLIKVNTCLEMYDAVMTHIAYQDIFIGAAAVADFRPNYYEDHKLVKQAQDFQLHLTPNPDIIAAVAALPDKPFVVGFAAQTHDVEAKAQAKLQQKNLDLIAANQVGVHDQGFGVDTNALAVISADGVQQIALNSKTQVARELLTIIQQRYQHESITS